MELFRFPFALEDLQR